MSDTEDIDTYVDECPHDGEHIVLVPDGLEIKAEPVVDIVLKIDVNDEDCTDECSYDRHDIEVTEDEIDELNELDALQPISTVAVEDEGDILRKSFAEISKKPAYNGRIELILGPMYGGKSSELLRRVRKYSAIDIKCVIIKYAGDVRYSEDFATHDRQKHRAISCKEYLNDVHDECAGYDVIGVDEGQFFPDLVDFCEHMANEGKVVVVSALDGNSERENFGAVHQLIPKCEFIEKFRAMCKCGNEASFTHFLGDMDASGIKIGGVGEYVSLCRECYHKANPVVKVTPPVTPVSSFPSYHEVSTIRTFDVNVDPVANSYLVPIERK